MDPRNANWGEVLTQAGLNGSLSTDEGSAICFADWGDKLATTLLEDFSQEERTELAEHITVCSACAARVRDYQMIDEAVRKLPYQRIQEPEPDPKFPTMLQRMWTVRETLERAEKYVQIKSELERRRRERKRIALLVIQFVTILLLVALLVISQAALVIALVAVVSSAIVLAMTVVTGEQAVLRRMKRIPLYVNRREKKFNKQVNNIVNESELHDGTESSIK